MCLAVPGQIVALEPHSDPLLRMATVDFGGVKRTVSLAYVADAGIGDYVIVHVGFALSKIDAAAAERIFQELEAMGEAIEREERRHEIRR